MARKKEAKKVDVDTIAQTEAPQKRAGRKPMTAEEKAAASKKRAEERIAQYKQTTKESLIDIDRANRALARAKARLLVKNIPLN